MGNHGIRWLWSATSCSGSSQRERENPILWSPHSDQLSKDAEGFGAAFLWQSSTSLSAATKYSFFSKTVGTNLWRGRLFRTVTDCNGFGGDKVNFFTAACMALCFKLVTKPVLITHPRYSYWTALAQRPGLLCLWGCPCSQWLGVGKSWEGTRRTAEPTWASLAASWGQPTTMV